jgi:CRP/FNR family cyclic AMP-dependent transcriptional regulator
MVSRAAIDERLQQVPLFAACSKKELRQISRLMTTIDVPAGQTLAAEGKLGAEFVVIDEGTATVTKKGRKVAELGPGRWFGEVALLDDRHLRTATVTAATPMVVHVIDGPSFSKLIDEHPRIARKILQGLAHLVAETATS